MEPLVITKDNFEEEVLKADKPVLVDFWAAWCGPCKMMLPVVGELANEVTDAKVAKINVDEQQELAAKYQVSTIPTFILFKDGKEVKRSIGVVAKSHLMNLIEENK